MAAPEPTDAATERLRALLAARQGGYHTHPMSEAEQWYVQCLFVITLVALVIFMLWVRRSRRRLRRRPAVKNKAKTRTVRRAKKGRRR